MPETFVVPDEEHVEKAAQSDAYFDLIRRLSHQSVVKHFAAYADIEWDNPEFRIDPDDSRWELEPDDVLGATEWYRAQPAGIRSGLRPTSPIAPEGRTAAGPDLAPTAARIPPVQLWTTHRPEGHPARRAGTTSRSGVVRS